MTQGQINDMFFFGVLFVGGYFGGIIGFIFALIFLFIIAP